MLTKKAQLFWILTAIILLNGCVTKTEMLADNEISITCLNVVKATPWGQDIAVNFAVENTHSTPIEIDRLEYIIKIGSNGTSHGSSYKQTSFEPMKKTTYQTYLHINIWKNLRRVRNYKSRHHPINSVDYTVAGTFRSGLIFMKEYKFNSSGRACISKSG